MKWVQIWSKIINRIKLIGKWVHRYRIRKANEIITLLTEINENGKSGGRVISYLRKINPFVFEEMIMNLIERQNIRVYRNRSYSGDGGLDGMFKIESGKFLIQCKRYKNYIDNKDVTSFADLIRKNKCYGGIFVHTGKTGDKSKKIVEQNPNIVIISGDLLVKLITKNLDIKKLLVIKGVTKK